MLRTLAISAGALWLSLAAALVVAWVRRTRLETLQAAVPAALLVLALQVLHFSEEFFGNYQDRIFRVFDRHGWPDKMFVIINLGWIAAWALACAGALTRIWPFPSATFLWFLGIAALLNGVVAPALAIVTWGYFPGLVTSPFLWLAGLFLVRQLRK